MAIITYTERRPSPALAARVECYWTIQSPSPVVEAHSNRVVPDGCMDLIFNLGERPLAEGCPHHRLRNYVVGAMQRPSVVQLNGLVDTVGIRFRPGGLAGFLPMPAGQLRDEVLDLTRIHPRTVARLHRGLARSDTFAARVELLEGFLRDQLDGAIHPAVWQASTMIERSDGTVSVQALDEVVDVSGRHLERLFHQQVGLTPKDAVRVARFRRAAALLRERPSLAFAQVALAAGYYDQPHFTRDFKTFAGLTPTAYRAERAHVASVQDVDVDVA